MEHLSFNPFPVLGTARLRLRQPNDNDAASLLAMRSDENVMRYIDRPRSSTLEHALTIIRLMNDGIASNSGINWAMSLSDDPADQLVGTIGFWRIDKPNYRAEIGYMLSPVHFRKGLMDEAMTHVLRYGFDVMKLHSVEAHVNPGNMASASLLRKHGFTREAQFRESHYYDGRFIDSDIYCLLTPHR